MRCARGGSLSLSGSLSLCISVYLSFLSLSLSSYLSLYKSLISCISSPPSLHLFLSILKASIWAGDLITVYSKYAETEGWTVSPVSDTEVRLIF